MNINLCFHRVPNKAMSERYGRVYYEQLSALSIVMCEKNAHKSVGQRLRDSIKGKGMSFKEFSDISDIPYRTLQQYIADERMPGGEMLVKIHAQLNISTDWLLTGEGHMVPVEPIEELGELIKKLSKHQQQALLGLAQEMLTVRAIVKKLGLDEEG